VPIQLSSDDLRFDQRPRSRIGLIALATDHSSEPDFHTLVSGPDIGVYTTRIVYDNPTTPENLRKTLPRLSGAAELILPDEDLDAICFSCTSASVAIGDSAVFEAIRSGKPGVEVITPTRAVVAGLHALGVSKVDVLTPYNLDTSTMMGHYVAAAGFDVRSLTYFGLEDDRDMARITPESLAQAAARAATTEAEAMFISCTALRAAEAAPDIEAEIGRPVVTSNLATCWMARQLVGAGGGGRSRARLFQTSL
jgi:maleate isomerase